MKKPSITFLSFLQALGVFTYCGGVSYLMNNGENIFGNEPNFMGPLLFLTLFITSALVTGTLMLGMPIKLFFIDNKKKDAISMLVQNTLWMMVFVALIIFIFVLF